MLKRCVCFSPVESSRTNSTFVRFPYMEMSPACAKAWTMFIFSSGTSITFEPSSPIMVTRKLLSLHITTGFSERER